MPVALLGGSKVRLKIEFLAIFDTYSIFSKTARTIWLKLIPLLLR